MGIALRSRRHRRQHSIVSVQEIDLSQIFYREFDDQVCMTGQNTTDAATITFAP